MSLQNDILKWHFKYIWVNENFSILIKMPVIFIPDGSIDNKTALA